MREQRKGAERREVERRVMEDRRHVVVVVAIERRQGGERRAPSDRRSGADRRQVPDRRGLHKGMTL